MASERIRSLLQERANPYRELTPPALFVQMDELMTASTEGEDQEWQETKRWIRYEECVESQGERWGKPHVSTISLQSVLDLKQFLRTSIVQLEVQDVSMAEIINTVVTTMVPHHGLTAKEAKAVRKVLCSPHHPQVAQRDFKEKKKQGQTRQLNPHLTHDDEEPEQDQAGTKDANANPNFDKSKIDKRFTRKLPSGAETANIFVGEMEGLSHPVSCLVRIKTPFVLEGVTEVEAKTRFLFIILGPQKQAYPKQYREIGRAMATLFCDEVFHHVVYSATSGQDLVDGIEEFLEAVTLLPPSNWIASMHIDPPGIRPDARKKDLARLLNPNKGGALPKADSLVSLALDVQSDESDDEHEADDPALQRSGRLFGGLVADVKRRLPWYWSDFSDALHVQCISSTMFLYFAAFTPIVTFGALMGEGTHEFIGTIECIVAGAVCGVIYHLFAGQALTVLGPTGPMFVLEVIVFHFSEDHGLSYLSFRLWIGVWTGFFLIILVMFDLSALVSYITRFTEEAFASLISAIFVYDAIRKMADIRNYTDTEKFLVECFCDVNETIVLLLNNTMNSTMVDVNGTVLGYQASYYTSDNAVNLSSTTLPPKSTYLEDKECFENHGRLMGCHHVGHSREIFHLSILWFLLTFAIATTLHWARQSRFFPTKLRNVLSDFCVLIAILIVTGCDALVGIGTPKLITPAKFAPSHPNRDWLVKPLDNLPWWAPLAASLPAVIATILIFMDQQITAVIVNRKDNKMKKGAGYHLDLLVVAILVVVCSVFGLPWYVASTVVAITHVTSLRKESECCAPGDVPQFIGVREQRITGIIAHILIGLSILFTPVLSRVPLPVLYGVFLYMGVSSLRGLKLVDRILILFMPAKDQPEYSYLTAISPRRVHLFTFIQVICLILLLVIKKIKVISMGFPIMVLGLCFVRNVIIERIFKKFELKKLDSLLPKKKKKFTPKVFTPGQEELQPVDSSEVRKRKPGKLFGDSAKNGKYTVQNNKSIFARRPSPVTMVTPVLKKGPYSAIAEDAEEELVNNVEKEGANNHA